MSVFKTKVKTAFALGVLNLARAISYRVGIKLGLNPLRRLRAVAPQGGFFSLAPCVSMDLPSVQSWQSSGQLFGRWTFDLHGTTPDWHCNPLTGRRFAESHLDWWQIPDFDAGVGDIKSIWETSRFDWVLAFAQRARVGQVSSVDRLDKWLADWCEHNPPYKGPNWKCGQEASIRVMHLAFAALILEQVEVPAPALLSLMQLHLQRIEPTLSYAIAQDNNHGTSEAAALYIGGSWLMKQGIPEGKRWFCLGRKWLENRAARLIGDDGSFSQYSLNYHRMVLDTLCMVEVWRRRLCLPAFSSEWTARALAASEWLRAMINPLNGDGPNLGANDGARLLQLTDTDYRDYRPSVQMATVLFANARAYPDEGSWDLPLRWLGLESPLALARKPVSRLFDDGGFAVLRCGSALAMLRYPRFRFRPSQSDALHLDLWLGERNLLRDAGTYSYNTDAQWLSYFPGTASHNTVQFDDHDQMPRLSRFLFGDWLRTSYIEPISEKDGVTRFGVAYKARRKIQHQRAACLSDTALKVIDKVEGFTSKAVLRWRLEPGHWRIEGSSLFNGDHMLTVESSVPVVRFELVTGWESRYYLDKEPIPVLEVEVHQPGSLITEYRWAL